MIPKQFSTSMHVALFRDKVGVWLEQSPLVPSPLRDSPEISTADISRATLDPSQGLLVLAWVSQKAEPEMEVGPQVVYIA